MKTSKNSTRQLTLDELISSQEGSPANPTPSPESERERRTSATCGPRCCALFENAPRATSWAKTFAALLVGMEGWSSRRCALTWKLKGTPSNRSYFQLVPSVLPTDEIESGLLLTPTTLLPTPKATEISETWEQHEKRAKNPKAKNRGASLSATINGMLPTPNAFDWNTARSQEAWNRSKDKWGDSLHTPLKQMAAFGILPKPCAQEGNKITGKENQDSLTKRARLQTGKTSQLSPLFVEEMMGFPKNWTAIPFLSGDEKA